jgi:hypothetical protein
MSTSPPRYAVVFKTHAWDGFISRQLDRYRAITGNGDVFLCLDETNGSLGSIDHDRVLRSTNADLVALGLADRAERGSLIWWNTDYPHYLFARDYPDYDYYVFVEYDTCINRDMDGLIADVAAAGADFVALPIRAPKLQWMWTRYHLPTYDLAEQAGSLNCICIVSNRGLHLLKQRRLEMSQDSAKGKVPFWPGNEVFAATEIRRAGQKLMSLEDFGNADGYEWYPPHLEDDLDSQRDKTFLHPVLDRARYMNSLLKFSTMPAFFYGKSRLGRGLKRFPEFRRQVPASLARRISMLTREKYQEVLIKLRYPTRRLVERALSPN